MEPVVFVSTDPTFMLVHNGLVGELNQNGLIHLSGQKTVQTQTFLHGNGREIFVRGEYGATFAKLYDFSRTAGSVLRMFMLEASGMRGLYDPGFGPKSDNLNSMHTTTWGDATESTDINQLQWNMAHDLSGDVLIRRKHRATRFAADFDRLFPHCVIEYQLNSMTIDQTKTVSGLMYVIYFDQKIIYYIQTTMDVKLLASDTIPPKSMIIHASVHVAVAKYKYDEPKINDTNKSEFTKFTLVRSLVEEWQKFQHPPIDQPLHLAMANINLGPDN